MTIFTTADFDGHEAVHAFYDRATGLQGFVAIHSTRLGPAFGGCRMWSYDSEADALADALRLSRGMSYKNALAELAYGGGKAVIMADPRRFRSPALFEAFGCVVDGLNGRYITAEDVGIGVEDMRIVARRTRHVSGIAEDGVGGDPSPRTAHGVLQGMRAAVRVTLGREDFDGLTVAVQGIGHVGFHLCRLLHEEGARLIVADVNAGNTERAAQAFGAKVVGPGEILFVAADILAPCALGGVLSGETIPQIRAQIVAGAANNQLATAEDGRLLMARGITYAPDYVINAGGIIAVAAEHSGETNAAALTTRIDRIYNRTLTILARARNEGRPPHEVADAMAEERIRLGDDMTAAPAGEAIRR